MSCCPPVSPSTAIGAAAAEASGPESDIRPGESVECYMARGGNTTGLHDDATGNVLNKIENNSIPVTITQNAVTVNVQFKLTAGSSPATGIWSMDAVPSGLTLTSGGLLTGTLVPGTYKVQVTVTTGSSSDTRGFVFGGLPGADDTKIQLISPLPGAIVNSKFGPRMHPIQQVMKPHTGIDMKYQDHSVQDVVAACDGEVVFAGGNPSTGYGVRVWIKHSSGSGKHVCTTTYNHLNKVYVSTGQRVMAGQKVGLEGTTGSSTGNHLHFECQLPDGKFIDPEPLIRGPLVVADSTLPNGDAGITSTRISTASLSEAESVARQAGCEPFGSSYPAASPPETSDPVPPSPPSNDPFELAWYFIMTHEVGPFWTNSSPSDPEVAAGGDVMSNIPETGAQRKKVGYVHTPNYPGGETKFGVAQKPNPGLVVRTATYDQAKLTGYNNYWKSAPKSCTTVSKKVSIMLFDMNYLHGGGNARTIYNDAGITSSPGDNESTQLAHCRALTEARLVFISRIPRPEFTRGWLRRANACLSYVQSLPVL